MNHRYEFFTVKFTDTWILHFLVTYKKSEKQVKLIIIDFISPNISKILSFQYVMNIKNYRGILYFFSYQLLEIFTLKHIANTQELHVAQLRTFERVRLKITFPPVWCSSDGFTLKLTSSLQQHPVGDSIISPISQMGKSRQSLYSHQAGSIVCAWNLT